jgi:hypothetical protein
MSETLGNKALPLATAAHTDAHTETGLAPVIAPPSRISEKHELFCLELAAHGNVGDAYMAVYPRAGSRRAAWANGCRLRARQDVQGRLRELKAAAAAVALIEPAVLLQELYEIATCDPADVCRVEILPCDRCWPDDALGAAMDRWIASDGDPPDSSAPEPTCKCCRGRGIPHVAITPTDALRGPARRLYQGAKVKSDGSVEVHLADQLAARKELHMLLGMAVHKSESKNLNINATVPTPAVSVEDALAAWKATR